MPSPPDPIIYFDGGASPNPGAMIVAVVCGAHSSLVRLDGLVGGNNEAEFRAACAALDHAAAASVRQPVIAGDSDTVIAAMSGERPPKPGRLTRLYAECVAKDRAIGGAVWRRVGRDNPAGRLIGAMRRADKAERRRARDAAPTR